MRSAKDPDGRVVLTWEGTATLQRATSVQGPFVEVPTSSPGRYEESVVPGSTAFFRLRR
ncbi:MAG: hypothetical protein JNL97_07990 [Verrucomicrobiales bacterium]|nr:hypothetical protein [Verrucomicrobiales bacterium]